jgi:hypothetical protein
MYKLIRLATKLPQPLPMTVMSPIIACLGPQPTAISAPCELRNHKLDAFCAWEDGGKATADCCAAAYLVGRKRKHYLQNLRRTHIQGAERVRGGKSITHGTVQTEGLFPVSLIITFLIIIFFFLPLHSGRAAPQIFVPIPPSWGQHLLLRHVGPPVSLFASATSDLLRR